MDIVITGLNKAYGEQRVLEDFSVRFAFGQTTCLMGDSGLGKTTLFRIMMGLTPADSGSIEGMEGKKISAVFQEDRVLESFNAVANVRFAAAKGIGRREIVADLEALGLGDSLYKPASQLSGGMRRRVVIARAILSRANVYFLDEPFQGLDAQSKQQTAGYIKDRAKGQTVLMVTHDPEEVALMEGHLFLMGRR
ncbi:MAG: ABC transporter ATP-binding protein [Peptococcaceae bacterium]|jgi:ABC-type multidrug transport system ATPase subunit|nr:ABC transporter ATP-binding protein [Peptococcaceae bacterium]